MQSTKFEFRIAETGVRISPTSVEEFVIRSSIHTSYPTGEMLLQDPEGRILSELMIRPGSILQVAGIDSDFSTYPLAPMVIVGIENVESGDDLKFIMMNDELAGRTGALGGYVRVHLAHIWGLYTNWRNRGFTKTSISDIVREIIKETSRGFAFEKVVIGDSDDGTNGPNRYKLQESEAAFIAHKLLPYSTIGSMAVYSFVNEMNEFFFQNFKYMYGQDARISIVPPQAEMAKAADIIGLSKLKNVHQFSEGSWFIGNQFKDQLGAIKKLIYIDDSESKISYRMLAAYRSAIPGYTLLKRGFIESTSALASELHPFRSFSDGIRLALNRNSIMNEFFEVSVTTKPCFELAAVGYPVDLRLVLADADKAHWANGKWLITQSEHGYRGTEEYSKLRLSRPAIDNLPDRLDADEFYKVEV